MFSQIHADMVGFPYSLSNITKIQVPREATHVPPDSFFRDSFTNWVCKSTVCD